MAVTSATSEWENETIENDKYDENAVKSDIYEWRSQIEYTDADEQKELPENKPHTCTDEHTPKPTQPRNKDEEWQLEIKECETFAMTYELSKNIQRMTVNKTLHNSCMKCSYSYQREYIDEIESDIFEEQSPVYKAMSKIINSKEESLGYDFGKLIILMNKVCCTLQHVQNTGMLV